MVILEMKLEAWICMLVYSTWASSNIKRFSMKIAVFSNYSLLMLDLHYPEFTTMGGGDLPDSSYIMFPMRLKHARIVCNGDSAWRLHIHVNIMPSSRHWIGPDTTRGCFTTYHSAWVVSSNLTLLIASRIYYGDSWNPRYHNNAISP